MEKVGVGIHSKHFDHPDKTQARFGHQHSGAVRWWDLCGVVMPS